MHPLVSYSVWKVTAEMSTLLVFLVEDGQGNQANTGDSPPISVKGKGLLSNSGLIIGPHPRKNVVSERQT